MKCLPCSCHKSSHHFNPRYKVVENVKNISGKVTQNFLFRVFYELKTFYVFTIQFVFYFSCYKE